MIDRSRPEAPPRGILRGESKSSLDVQKDKIRPELPKKDLHVLALVPGQHKRFGISSATSVELLKGQLLAAEKFLTKETTFSNRKAYKDSNESTRDAAYNYLTSLAQKVDDDGSDSVRLAYEKRVDIFNAADSLYRLFLPKGFDDPTSRKFWGALQKMLIVSFPVLQQR